MATCDSWFTTSITTTASDWIVPKWRINIGTGTTTSTSAVTDLFWNPVKQSVGQVVPAPARVQPPRGFNRYVNASDLMEEFIRWLGGQGVRQREVRGLPVDLFIKWLVIRACEEDHEEPNVTLELPAPKQQLRCIQCRRFMPALPVPFDRAECAARYFKKAS